MSEKEIVEKIVDDIILGGWDQSIYWVVEQSDFKGLKKRKIFTDLVESILTEYNRHNLTGVEGDNAKAVTP